MCRCQGVFTAIEAKETKVPSESSLLSSVQAARELLDMNRLRALHWIDTRDMISDGLNKGSVDRIALQTILEKNVWIKIGDSPCTLTCFMSAGAVAHEFRGWLKRGSGSDTKNGGQASCISLCPEPAIDAVVFNASSFHDCTRFDAWTTLVFVIDVNQSKDMCITRG